MFKRRDTRPLWRIGLDFVYPRGGWRRAFYYLRHRLNRLPDTPSRISRGLACGVFGCYTPLFGFHIILSMLIARCIRGNMIAAFIATFYGNPVTFPIIAAVNLKLGHLILGTERGYRTIGDLWEKFAAAGDEFRDNAIAFVTGAPTDWSSLADFYGDVFLPYLIGGLGPGILSGVVAYYLTLPVVTAYQRHRRAKMRAMLATHRQEDRHAGSGSDEG